MKRESAIALKNQILSQDLWAGIARPTAAGAVESVRASAAAAPRPKNPAIGVRGKRGKYRLAVRIQNMNPGTEKVLEKIRQRAKSEVDVRLVGRVFKQQSWHQSRNRPLRIGGSIGHFKITAGTLGCFVSRDGNEYVLSNNHVLANENDANKGANILQPAKLDGGKNPQDTVADLDRFIKLKKSNNLVDAAMAVVKEGIEYYYNWLEGLGEITGVRAGMPEEGETVFKVGRTTGLTEGRISAFEVDNLDIEYDMGVISFDNQLEIEPVGNHPFSLGGDSGSLIVDSQRRALGLLIAGNDVDATYANPIGTVLEALQVKLVF